MPIFYDTSLTLRDTVADTAGLNLDDVWSVYTYSIGGVSYVYVAGAADDGITVFSVGADGTLTFEHNINDTATSFLDGVSQMLSIRVGSNNYMYVASRLDDAINVYSIENDGNLTFVSAQNATALNLDNAAGKMSTVKIGGITYLIVAGARDDGFSIFEARIDGTLTERDNVIDAVNLDFIYDTATIEINGNHFLYTASFASDTLSAYQIGTGGQASLLYHLSDSANPDLDLNGLVGLETGEINGTAFLFSASLVDDTVTVFTIDGAGALTEVDSIAASGIWLLDGTHGLEFFEFAGAHYLAVTGRTDRGLSFFSVEGDGTLTLLSDTAHPYLANALYVAHAEVNGNQFLISGGEFGAGIVSYEIGGASDVLTGGAGDDVLLGFGGDDILDGGLGDDLIDGGGGADTLDMSGATSGGVTVVLLTNGSETGYTVGALGNDVLRGIENVYGTVFADSLFGSSAVNVLWGNDGDDVLSGEAGDDFLFGGDGDDELRSGVGNDFLDGGAGNDRLTGRAGMNTLLGRDGDDMITMFAWSGANTMDGGDGIDTLVLTYTFDYVVDLRDGTTNIAGETAVNFENITLGIGNDTVTGTDFDNTIRVGDGNDTVYGLGGNDIIFGGSGDNIIYGGDGDDRLTVREGHSMRYGESGDDYFIVLLDFAHGFIDGGAGFDTIDARSSSVSRTFDFTTSDLSNIERILTSDLNDMIIGDDTLSGYYTYGGDDIITTGSVRSSVFAGAGNDTVYGGAGDDSVRLDGGDDTAYLGDGDDRVFYSDGVDVMDGGAGVDTYDAQSYAGNYQINLATGQTNIAGETALNFENAFMGAGNNVVIGNSSDNFIVGGDGHDVITGGAGDDVLFGGDDNDIINGGDGIDLAYYVIDYSQLTFSHSGGVTTVTTPTGIDTLQAVEAARFIFLVLPVHLLGGPQVDGTSGADSNLEGTSASEIIFGLDGDDVLYGLGGDDALIGGGGDDILYGGTGADFMDGGFGDDTIYANAGDDFSYLFGGTGTDTLYLESEIHLNNDYRANGFETAFVQNAAGQTLQIFTTPSTGGYTRLQTLDFNNSQLWSLMMLDTDVADIRIWTTRTQFRNDANQNYEIHFENDDGTSLEERYDVENDDSYTILALHYNALGQLDTVVNDQDNGRRVTTDYDPDDNEAYNFSILTEDLANEGLWESVLDLRNDAGQRYFLQNIYDNDLRVELEFDVDNAQPYFRLVTNFDDSAAGDLLNYQTAVFYQNDLIQTYQIDVLADDGVRSITDYDLPNIEVWDRQRVRTDEADIYSWGTIIEQFNALNQLQLVSQTNEQSYDTLDEFDLLNTETWSRRQIYHDDEDLYNWESITFLYDNNGDVYQTDYVYDS